MLSMFDRVRYTQFLVQYVCAACFAIAYICIEVGLCLCHGYYNFVASQLDSIYVISYLVIFLSSLGNFLNIIVCGSSSGV